MFSFYCLSEEDFSLEIPDWIKDKAKYLGINTEGMNKFSAIREIQRVEGNTVCYGELKAGDVCPYKNCCFYKDCRGMQ